MVMRRREGIPERSREPWWRERLTALLLNADLKSSLAAIRSLGRRGVPIIAGCDRRSAMGLYSRYVSSTFVYPAPLQDRFGFVDAVIDKARRVSGKVVLFAFSDATLLPLAGDERFLKNYG